MQRFSEYSLSTYMLCPRKYYHTFVEKGKKKRVIHANFIFGGIIHETCKDFYNFKMSDRTLENLYSLFRSIWKKNGIRDFFDNKEEERKLGLQGLSMLSNFYQRFGDKTPFRTEEYIEYKINNYTLFGRIDRIDTNDDGTLTIIDYKTTGNYQEEDGSKERERKMLQLRMYAFLLHSIKRMVTKGRYYYFTDNVFDEIEFTEDNIKYYAMVFDELIEDIMFDRKFIKEEGRWCKYCDYSETCLSEDIPVKLPDEYHSPLFENSGSDKF